MDPNTSLSKLNALCREHGIRLFFTINPRKNWWDYIARLKVLRNESSIEYVDIAADFDEVVARHRYREDELSLPHDIHPTPLRHRIYGDLLTPAFWNAIGG
jgi:hypothetical protein